MKSEKINIGLVISMITIMITFFSCAAEEMDKETRIQLAIEEKVVEYRQKELERCIERIKIGAEAEVDSILRKMSKQEKIDTISPPSRFRRPRKPDLQFQKFEKPLPIKVDSSKEDTLKH